MSEFTVNILPVLEVKDHPNADRLSLVTILGYTVVSNKLPDGSHRYRPGDLVLYVPENAVVPENLLKLGFWDEKNNKGFLSGSKGNRVKPITLRGILSEGIMFPVRIQESSGDDSITYVVDGLEDKPYHFPVDPNHNIEDQNVANHFSIVKYEPPIPTSLGGQVKASKYKIPKFDFDNLKRHPNYLQEGDGCIITRKLHGTFMGIGFFEDGTAYCFSKGLGQKDLIFVDDDEASKKNVYVKCLNKVREQIEHTEYAVPGTWIFGEVVGKGVQDLHYGFDDPKFFVFNIITTNPLHVPYISAEFERVPVLYTGEWHPDLKALADGYDEAGKHVHEGIVIQFWNDRFPDGARLKIISDAYHNRKNGTEYT